MPYAVTLPLDDTAASHVERMWRVLADETGDDAVRLDYVPHVTLAILPDPAPREAIEEATFKVVERWGALSTALTGVGVFPGAPPVIWMVPVVTESLLARHASLHEVLAPFFVHPHYRPGAWVPHVTLSEQGPSPVGQVVELVASVWEGPINVCLERVELVRFKPVEVLRSQAFGVA